METASRNNVHPAQPQEPLEAKFPVSVQTIAQMIERKDSELLKSLGGVEGLADSLRVEIAKGVDESQHADRVLQYGRNELPAAEKVTFFGLIFEAMKDKLIIILSCAAVISIILGETVPEPGHHDVDRETGWIEGAAIIISVCVVIMVGATSDYQKAKKFEALHKEQEKRTVQILRRGIAVPVDIHDIVVGDIMLVDGGQQLAVDAIVIEGQDLKADESAANGESDHVKKTRDKDCFLLSGTSVVEGEGRSLVVAVGINSFAGNLAMSTRKPAGETPLQIKLGMMADRIGKFGIIAAACTFVGLVISTVIRGHWDWLYLLKFIIISISIVVVAIPEGLPLAVTIALAFSMKAMLQDKCLVRVLKSCETMGGCTAICSDKTGTLTKNQMTVVQGWLAGESFVLPGFGVEAPPEGATNPFGERATKTPELNDPGRQQFLLRTQEDIVQLICESISLNSTADEITDKDTGRLVWTGNKTEQGLLGFVAWLRPYKDIRSAINRENKRAYPFSSAKKRMTTIVRHGETWIMHVKGASEMVLEDCTHWLDSAAEKQPLDRNKREEMLQTISFMANQGNRTIAVAFSEQRATGNFPDEEPTPDLCLIGIMGIQDPIRPEVPEAVRVAQKAGITIRMVTGDNINTAKAIARKCGIFTNGGKALEGKEFREIAQNDPERLKDILPRLQVLARSSPTDKHVLVDNLMKMGNIVAVTGDGTNDAPALTLADVGFAMYSGTEIARGASDMVLIDDNFATVIRATMWGRTVNDNIRKFLQFQLTVNFVGVMLTFIGSVVAEDGSSPLNAVQLLWLNLIMDTMAALALATERPNPDCLNREPVYRGAPLISKKMWVFVSTHGLFQLAVVLILIYTGHLWFRVGDCHPEFDTPVLRDTLKNPKNEGNCRMGIEHRTVIFNTFILFQVVNEFNARKLYGEYNPFSGITRSAWFIFILPALCVFQILAVMVFGRFMGTVPLTWDQWLICSAIALLELPVGLIARFIGSFVKEYKPPNTHRQMDDEKSADRRDSVSVTSRNNDGVLTSLRVVGSMHPRRKSDAALRAWGEAGDMRRFAEQS